MKSALSERIAHIIEERSKIKLSEFQEKLLLSDDELISFFPYNKMNFLSGVSTERLTEIERHINPTPEPEHNA